MLVNIYFKLINIGFIIESNKYGNFVILSSYYFNLIILNIVIE
jgi:hypothetical protein